MQNKRGGLSLDLYPLAANNGPFGGMRLDIPALVEFPLYPVPAQEYWFVSVNVCDMMPYPFVFFIREVAPDQEPGNLFII